jgi:hypothetical protein
MDGDRSPRSDQGRTALKHMRSRLGILLGACGFLSVLCGFSQPEPQHAPGSSRPPDLARLDVPPNSVLPTETNDEGIAAGNTAGSLQVSSDGDLVYNFPLWIPPGRNGVQPPLSLNYRSRAPNGLVGVGWSIAGLSQITRCAQTTARNGENIPVAFDTTDRFRLDGQQLVAVNGTYGTDSAIEFVRVLPKIASIIFELEK